MSSHLPLPDKRSLGTEVTRALLQSPALATFHFRSQDFRGDYSLAVGLDEDEPPPWLSNSKIRILLDISADAAAWADVIDEQCRTGPSILQDVVVFGGSDDVLSALDSLFVDLKESWSTFGWTVQFSKPSLVSDLV